MILLYPDCRLRLPPPQQVSQYNVTHKRRTISVKPGVWPGPNEHGSLSEKENEFCDFAFFSGQSTEPMISAAGGGPVGIIETLLRETGRP